MKARLRVCLKCEWMFNFQSGCPVCGFCSYSAHSIYGRNAYRYAKTQKPWFDRKMANYADRLNELLQRHTVPPSSYQYGDLYGYVGPGTGNRREELEQV